MTSYKWDNAWGFSEWQPRWLPVSTPWPTWKSRMLICCCVSTLFSQGQFVWIIQCTGAHVFIQDQWFGLGVFHQQMSQTRCHGTKYMCKSSPSNRCFWGSAYLLTFGPNFLWADSVNQNSVKPIPECICLSSQKWVSNSRSTDMVLHKQYRLNNKKRTSRD